MKNEPQPLNGAALGVARVASIPMRSGGAVRETAGVPAKPTPAPVAKPQTPEEAAASALLGQARAAEARRYSMALPRQHKGNVR